MREEIDAGRVVFGADETTNPRVRRNLFESDKQVMRSVTFSYAQTATMEFNKIFDNARVFENPKSIDDIKKLVAYITESNNSEIVLDFFSGSATTAHAVMQLNAEDGGNRRFICVQLPEVTDENSEAFKAGFKNICEIRKERIRRAGKKIYKEGIEKWTEQYHGQEELPETVTEDGMIESGAIFHSTLSRNIYGKGDKTLDTGFRVFKLDSSNLKLWDDAPITGEDALLELEQRIYGMLDIIKPDRSNIDVVYEVMLKLGQQPTQPIIPIELSSGRTVYGVGTGEGAEVKFIVCLVHGITPEDAEEMAKYAPGRIIFSDSCFDNSEQKSNVRLTLKDKGIAIKAL
jgi:adenine-specific DNA-methyltransferase